MIKNVTTACKNSVNQCLIHMPVYACYRTVHVFFMNAVLRLVTVCRMLRITFFTFKISLLYFKPAFLICCIRSESAMMEVILNCPPCQVQPQKNGLVQFITYLAGRFAIVQEKKCGINFLSDF